MPVGPDYMVYGDTPDDHMTENERLRDEAEAILLIVIEFLEKLDRMEIGDEFPNYKAGLWSRENIRALAEDLKGPVEKPPPDR